VGNGGLSASAAITASGLANNGRIDLVSNGVNQAAVIDTAAAPPSWSGTVNLTDNALLQFASGAITTIGADAQINENGAHARVALASDPASNSALTTLASNSGQLYLANGATLTT